MQVYLLENQIDKALGAGGDADCQGARTTYTLDYLLGSVLFEKKDLEGAEAAFKQSAQLNPNNTDALLKLGQVQATKGRVDEALGTCQRALQDNPREPGLLILIGQLYDSRKDWERAKEAYRKALEIAPENPLA